MGKFNADNATAEKIAFYESARGELIQRLALRDQSIIAYIATAGGYYGIVLGPSNMDASATTVASEASMVLVLPVLSLVFTYITLQHHVMIGKIGEFARAICKDGCGHWDDFYVQWDDKSYLSARTASQALLLILPVGYTAIFATRSLGLDGLSFSAYLLIAAVLLFDIVVLIMIVRLQLWAYRVRMSTDYLRFASAAPAAGPESE